MTRITIIGGGSLAHVCAGVLASRPDIELSVMSRKPQSWSDSIVVSDPDGKVFNGPLSRVSDNPEELIPSADLILLCLPGFAIEPALERIRDYAVGKPVGSIVSSTGFFFAAHRVLGPQAQLFGFQRVPFIARTTEYGRSANLLGYKPELAVALENIPQAEEFRSFIQDAFGTPTKLLGSHFEASLTNSNPILHTGRLYSMWKDWTSEVYDHNILFYKEWTVEASQLLISMDEEFMALLSVLPVTPGAIPSLLEYYESSDAQSLTRKISGIAAFQAITSPMKEVEGGWVPDFESRYFTEDFPYGLAIIRNLAHEKGVAVPTIDRVFEWGISKCRQ